MTTTPEIRWHNPDNLTDEQVGVSEGWRLCIHGEPLPTDWQWWCRNIWRHCGDGSPTRTIVSDDTQHSRRTREPLPEKYRPNPPDSEPDYACPKYLAKVEAAHKQGLRIRLRAKGNHVWETPALIGYFHLDILDYEIHPEDAAKFKEEAVCECHAKLRELAARLDAASDWFSNEYQKTVRQLWAENPSIPRQIYSNDGATWVNISGSNWIEGYIYRLKPTPQPVPLDDLGASVDEIATEEGAK